LGVGPAHVFRSDTYHQSEDNHRFDESVVVSSDLAFAARSKVSLSSVKAQETINAGLAEVCGALGLKGQVIAKVSGTQGW
jgi:hypothetical protein